MMTTGIYSMDTLDKGVVHVRRGTEQHIVKFHHTSQNDVQFLNYGFFIFGIPHLIFSDIGWPGVTETMESKTADEGK